MNNVLYLVRKKSVPALAHPASDVSRPWPCTLKMLYVELGARLTVSLESGVSIQGVDDEQLVALRFKGQNLVPGKGSLSRPVNIVLAAVMSSRLAQQGGSQVYVLLLVLKTPGAVWHPRTLSAEASGIDNLPCELSILARTTERVFWSAYEVAKSVESETAAAPPSIEDAQDDAPPKYEDAQVPRKRHTRSLTPDSPLPKRVLLEDLKRSFSPTERATPSSQGARSTTSSNVTVVADVWQKTITKGLDERLPERPSSLFRCRALLGRFVPLCLLAVHTVEANVALVATRRSLVRRYCASVARSIEQEAHSQGVEGVKDGRRRGVLGLGLLFVCFLVGVLFPGGRKRRL
ncbi:hypothetical protein CC86DRAFT_459470 [Ophiobolus disseminans]|uniref:Uncharacterized protein n=1 Tax=Ophiobolus disseminans TaxID=1469910 RepID=A0A6A6ZL05_9PLEO|nr:hypothetical protein CC86DRAFT_459470 [Ophiobolus disseminans]